MKGYLCFYGIIVGLFVVPLSEATEIKGATEKSQNDDPLLNDRDYERTEHINQPRRRSLGKNRWIGQTFDQITQFYGKPDIEDQKENGTWLGYGSEELSLNVFIKQGKVEKVIVDKAYFNKSEVTEILELNKLSNESIWKKRQNHFDEIIFFTENNNMQKSYWRPLEGRLIILTARANVK